jgi:hypothetical protein
MGQSNMGAIPDGNGEPCWVARYGEQHALACGLPRLPARRHCSPHGHASSGLVQSPSTRNLGSINAWWRCLVRRRVAVWARDEREQERRVASAGAMADCLGRVEVGMWACEMRHLRVRAWSSWQRSTGSCETRGQQPWEISSAASNDITHTGLPTL